MVLPFLSRSLTLKYDALTYGTAKYNLGRTRAMTFSKAKLLVDANCITELGFLGFSSLLAYYMREG